MHDFRDVVGVVPCAPGQMWSLLLLGESALSQPQTVHGNSSQSQVRNRVLHSHGHAGLNWGK